MDDDPACNDIPEGLARMEALNHAVGTSAGDETADQIVTRASIYYAFLTMNRTRYSVQ